MTPAPIWGLWWLLLIPLVAAVAVVYKAMKCAAVGQIPREAAVLTGWILAAMLAAGLALGLLVTFMSCSSRAKERFAAEATLRQRQGSVNALFDNDRRPTLDRPSPR